MNKRKSRENEMKKYLMLSVISLMLIIFSCSTQTIQNEFPYGSYAYTSFNIAGEIVGEGTLFISKVDSNIVGGNWSIRNLKNCVVCGPQYGSGYFEGHIKKDSVYINLNPNTPQNYVELVGEIKDGNFYGDWRWFELIVNSNRGTFKAIKQ
jgi:hypothetical protein